MDLTRNRGIHAEREDTVLTARAAEFLATGPADVVALIGHVCNLPGAPRIVAEHMAQAMFSGRTEFGCNSEGKWMLLHPIIQPYSKDAAGKRAVAAIPASLLRAGAAEFGVMRSADRRSYTAPRGGGEALCGLSYVVVDVETTGGRAYFGDRITEIACVVIRNGEIAEVFETLVNPERPIPPFVTQLTNITAAMVRNAPTFERVAPDLLRVLEGNVFVAHNATFDWRFLTAELSRCAGQRLKGRRICTVKLARKVLPQLSRRSLDNVARYYGVEIVNRHRAGGDAVATARCLIRMLSDLADRGCATWDELDFLLAKPSTRRKKRRRQAMPHSVTNDTTA